MRFNLDIVGLPTGLAKSNGLFVLLFVLAVLFTAAVILASIEANEDIGFVLVGVLAEEELDDEETGSLATELFALDEGEEEEAVVAAVGMGELALVDADEDD